MDYQTLTAGISVISLFIAIASFFRNSQKDTEQTLNGFGQRLAKVEEKANSLPTEKEISLRLSEVYEAMKRIKESVDKLNGMVEGLKEIREQDRELRRQDHDLLKLLHNKIIKDSV